MSDKHPSRSELLAFANGELDDARFEEVAQHLESCRECDAVLRETGAAPIVLGDTDQTTQMHEPIKEGPGSLVGPYKLLQKLGEGGMGVVYMAEQEKPVRRMVALKIIKPGMDSRQVIARFEAERQALAMMDHHHIAKVLDAGTTDTGRPYFAMELVKGVPITEYCDKNKLSPRERLEMFVPVCHAIQHAHQKGIIHRDIKPSNVLVTLYDGKPVPKVIDFGIAKATQQKLTERTMFTGIGQILGTLEYMSPEQAEMNQLDIDTRSDVYSLGVMLYELLTGSTPITKEELRNVGLAEMLRTIRETEPPKPSTRLSDSGEALPSISAVRKTEPAKLSKLVRGDLDWIVMKALEKDRTRRYETANGLAADVQRFLSDEAVEACPPSASYRFRKFARRNKAVIATTTAIASILLLSTVLSSYLAFRAMKAEGEASAKEQEAKNALAAESVAKREAEAQRKLAQANAKTATREATKSREVATFLKDMLKGVGPSVALGRDTTMLREILEKTATRLDDLNAHPDVEAELRHVIGDLYLELENKKEDARRAREMLERSVSLYGKLEPIPHPKLAKAKLSLAKATFYTGETERAVLSLDPIIAMRHNELKDHPTIIATAMSMKGGVNLQGGAIMYRSDESMKLLKDASEIHARYGNTDGLISALVRQARGAWLLRDKKKARHFLSRADEVIKSNYAANHPKRIDILLQWANASERSEDALDHLKEAVRIIDHLDAQTSRDANDVFAAVGWHERQLGNFSESLIAYRRRYKSMLQMFGHEYANQPFAGALWGLGQACYETDPDQAVAFFREAVEIAKPFATKGRSERQLYHISRKNLVALLHNNLGRHMEAHDELKGYLSEMRELGFPDWEVRETEILLALNLHEAERTTEAIEVLRECHRKSQDSAFVTTALRQIVEIAKESNDVDEAETWQTVLYTLAETKMIPRQELRHGYQGSGIILSPDDRFLYAPCWQEGTLEVFQRDTQSGEINLIQEFQEPWMRGAQGIAITPDDRFLVLSCMFSGEVGLYRRNTTSGKLELVDRTMRSDGSQFGRPGRMFALPGSRFVVVNDLTAKNEHGQEVGGVATLEVTESGIKHVATNTGSNSCFHTIRGMMLDEVNDRLYVMARNGVTCCSWDGMTGEINVLFSKANSEHLCLKDPTKASISPDGRFLYVTSGRWNPEVESAVGVFRIGEEGDLTLIQELRDSQLGGLIEGAIAIDISPDGDSVYIGGFLSSVITRFQRAIDGRLEGKESIGYSNGFSQGATTIAASRDGKHIYATVQGRHEIVVISTPRETKLLASE